MYVTYDKEADAMYISLCEEWEVKRVMRTQPVKDWLLIDFDAEGRVCGFELLDVSKHSTFQPTGRKEIKFIDLCSPEGEKYLAEKERLKAL